MTPASFFKILIMLAAFGYLSQAEARSVSELQNNINYADLNGLAQLLGDQSNWKQASEAIANSNSNDDDDDDDDRVQLQSPLQATATGEPMGAYYPSGDALGAQQTNLQQVAPASSSSDLKTSASYHGHHHGHHAKGWLDMGAWTGKKGAFGWHDKHPVGGKGRK